MLSAQRCSRSGKCRRVQRWEEAVETPVSDTLRTASQLGAGAGQRARARRPPALRIEDLVSTCSPSGPAVASQGGSAHCGTRGPALYVWPRGCSAATTPLQQPGPWST